MVCLPTARPTVLSVAVVTPPNVPTVDALPELVPSIINWTVPVGVPAPGAVTAMVAVNVTLCPDTDGSIEEATVTRKSRA